MITDKNTTVRDMVFAIPKIHAEIKIKTRSKNYFFSCSIKIVSISVELIAETSRPIVSCSACPKKG